MQPERRPSGAPTAGSAETAILDAELLREAERANIDTAASARFGVAVVIAALVLIASPRFDSFRFSHYVAGTNLALAALGVSLVRWGRSRDAVCGVLALVDVAFLLGVTMLYTRFPGTLPGQFRPAVIAVWGFFLALALTVIVGKPWLLAAQTLLFSGGFALAVAGRPSLAIGDRAVAEALSVAFGADYNAMRGLVILLTGTLLVAATVRSRSNLRAAIRASRRAASLGRYLSPAVAEIVSDTGLAALKRGRQQNVAVLFADVRGFTSLSEVLAPHEVADFLTRFRLIAVEAIEGAGGVVDKFVGDAVMGLFGLPAETREDAASAILAGHRLLAAVDGWSRSRLDLGLPPVRIGIGLHYGSAFVGSVGQDRLEFTVLGDTVNVASRIEALTTALGHDFIASAQAVTAAGERGSDWLSLSSQPLRGHREPVEVLAARRR